MTSTKAGTIMTEMKRREGPLPGGEAGAAEAQDMAVSVRCVSKSYSLKRNVKMLALKDVDLVVRPQEFVTIVGPSGCGKSTLLGLMAGLSKPDSGDIALQCGQGSLRHCLGFISQTDTLMPWRTVLANVEVGLELRGVARAERKDTARRLMAQVGLEGFERSYPFELSGGMQKRLSVIRTLAYDPDIIFMDEPFVGLDVQTRDALEEDIMKLWREHRKTIIMVTHDLAEAITLSDRVVLMTARPATIKAEYDIDLPRPRSVSETKFMDEFVRVHKQIWHDLSAEVLKATSEAPHA